MGAVRGTSKEVCWGLQQGLRGRRPWAGQSCSWLELAPGNNHQLPKPCQGIRQAGKCMAPRSNVFRKETGSHEGMETHSVGDPSCQRRS